MEMMLIAHLRRTSRHLLLHAAKAFVYIFNNVSQLELLREEILNGEFTSSFYGLSIETVAKFFRLPNSGAMRLLSYISLPNEVAYLTRPL